MLASPLALLAGDARAGGGAPEHGPGAAIAECYEFTVIPPLGIAGESGQRLVDLNENGVVLLHALPHHTPWYRGDAQQTAFVFAGKVRPVVVDGLLQTRAVDINDRDEVLVFGAKNPGVLPEWSEAVIWRHGELVARIASPPGTAFTDGAINERGHLVLETRAPRVYRWRGQALEDLDMQHFTVFNDADEVFDDAGTKWGDHRSELPTTCSEVRHLDLSISRHGTLAGMLYCDDLDWPNAVLVTWPEGQFTRLADETEWTELWGVTDRGDIIGETFDDFVLPVAWRHGETVRLPRPPSTYAGFYADINEHGLMVGAFDRREAVDFEGDDPDSYLFAVSDGTRVKQLPLPDPLVGYLDPIAGINDRGDIVGCVDDMGYDYRTMIWLPRPAAACP
ncbi:hypothetical protein [Nannocystis bainbridge]|uniref:Uncharacterized protein n=1 Tax=Nannocystis bainbridge TaxID=2995303 RepID=A0ABT5DRL0_9BACT|nr:hypothetical protein [Nannocystis bainbridge]MDC0716181.1 hypothetical protein [Nannocystis bainbridge]